LRKTRANPLALADCLRVAASFDTLAPGLIAEALAPVARRWFKRGRPVEEPSGVALRAILREASRRLGVVSSAAPWSDRMGEVVAWSWLGPFDSGHGSAFDRLDPIETQTLTNASYPGRDGAVSWQVVPDAVTKDPTGLRLGTLVERPAAAILFARSYVQLKRPAAIRIRLAALGPARLLIDGVQVLALSGRSETSGRRSQLLIPRASATVALDRGWHQLRVKLGAAEGHMWLGVELLDGAGRPLMHHAQATPPAGFTGQCARPAQRRRRFGRLAI